MENIKNILSLRVSDLKGPKRFYNESMEEFRKRREVENKFLKLYKKGSLLWDSIVEGTATRMQLKMRSERGD